MEKNTMVENPRLITMLHRGDNGNPSRLHDHGEDNGIRSGELGLDGEQENDEIYAVNLDLECQARMDPSLHETIAINQLRVGFQQANDSIRDEDFML